MLMLTWPLPWLLVLRTLDINVVMRMVRTRGVVAATEEISLISYFWPGPPTPGPCQC